MITIVGIGPGSRDYLLPSAVKALEKSDVIVGFERAVKSIGFIDGRKVVVSSISEIIGVIESEDGDVAVAASGDPLFYGITNYLKKNIHDKIKVIPGISSFQYFASKLVIPWNNAKVSSMHGRENSFIDDVKSSESSFWLTGKKNTPAMLCRMLVEAGIGCRVHVGEKLSYDDEIITSGEPKELMDREFSWLSVVAVELLDK